MTFVRTTLLIFAILAGLGLPLWYVAWREGRRDTIRNFVLGAVVVAVLAGIVALTSERALEQCMAANGRECIDPGADGVQLVMVGFYLIINWFVAYKLWSD
ncbi:MAG: hypothetical protein WCE80_11030 [Acidimicrobiia bacterium]